jgi:uncharacterized secreted protein with C-terminal beta-propeller domain
MIDGTARVVTTSSPVHVAFDTPARPGQEKQAAERNREAVERADAEAFLPRYELEDRSGDDTVTSSGPIVECDQVSHPAEPSGIGMITVLTVDPKDPKPDNATSVQANGEIVYASAGSLYVATNRWNEEQPASVEDGGGDVAVSSADAGDVTTQIHKFDISDSAGAVYKGSGEVPGQLLNQFSMSEQDGRLRVATTRGSGEAGSDSLVTVLEEQNGALHQVGQLGDLGPDERIYAVRFIGNLGYVVTFRQTDPLYVLDLSDPAHPRKTGELKIPGYSAYLHPAGDGLLLGLGQNADDQGRVLGGQLSLFDVSDPANPRRLAQASLGQGNSEAEYDHHAFLYWPATGLTVVPFQHFDQTDPNVLQVGATGFAVSRDGIRKMRDIEHPAAEPWDGLNQIRRSLVVGERIYTVSEKGLMASGLGDLAQAAWLAF